MKNNKGFTLTELLAVIVLIALVASISVYVLLHTIKNAEEKTYKITVNEITSNANEYLTENKDRIFFIADDNNNDVEYQCVTIKNLIDYGYLRAGVVKSKVSVDTFADLKDLVYVERDINTKAVIKTVYLGADNENICKEALAARGSIYFKVTPQGWSKSKQMVITYKVKNINDVNNGVNYTYDYIYNSSSPKKSGPLNELKDDRTNVIELLENGKMAASILADSEQITAKTINVDEIDNTGPTIAINNYNGNNIVKRKIDLPLLMTDDGIGADYKSFEVNDIIVKIGGKQIPQNGEKSNYQLVDNNNGKYTLTINDLEHAGELEIIITSGCVIDKLNNINDEITLKPGIKFDNTYKVTFDSNGGDAPSKKELTVTYGGKYGTLPTTKRSNYLFTGWYTAKSSGERIVDISVVALTADQTLYAHWVADNGKVSYTDLMFTASSTSSDGTTKTTYYVIDPKTGETHYYDTEAKAISAGKQYSEASNKKAEYGYTSGGTKVSTGTAYQSSYGSNSGGYTGTTSVVKNNSTGNVTWSYSSGGKTTSWTYSPSKSYSSGGYTPSGKGGCFLAGTKVYTLNGYKNIQDIEIGDYVLSYNELTKTNEYQQVLKLFKFSPDDINEELYTITLDDNTQLKVSSSHRFYVKDKTEYKWVAISDVSVNDYVLYADGNNHQIKSIETEELVDVVYNLAVYGNHNYYVGNQLILVHNRK